MLENPSQENLNKTTCQGYTLGLIRLVNPWRGHCYCANLETEKGILSARSFDLKTFGFYSVIGNSEFYPGRDFTRKELGEWLSGQPIPPDQRSQIRDEFGDIPAITPNSQDWTWLSITGRGEERLTREAKPQMFEIQNLAGAALLMSKDKFLPLLDPYELWVCDKDSLDPIALVLCDISLERIDWQQFNPMWRMGRGDLSFEFQDSILTQARGLQKEIHARVNTSTKASRFEFYSRIFKRNLDNSAIEYRRANIHLPNTPLEAVESHPIGFLPEGLLANPWEQKRLEIEKFRLKDV